MCNKTQQSGSLQFPSVVHMKFHTVFCYCLVDRLPLLCLPPISRARALNKDFFVLFQCNETMQH